MRALIVLCSLIAFGQAKPGWSYSSVDLTSPALVGTHGIIGARTYVAAPAYSVAPDVIATRTFAAAAPVVASAPVVAARTVAAAPIIAAAPAIAAAPVVEARTVAAAPVVAAAPALATGTVVATRTVASAPVVAAAPAAVVAAPAAVKSQWHAQDEIGQASYGHAEPGQTHTAVQDAHGNKVGSFSYLNPTDGLIHRTDYVADSLGYRVTANDLPVAAATPVVDTPEVAIARAAHLAAVHRAKRGVVVAHTPASTAPLVTPFIAAAPALTTYAAAPVVAPAAISYAAPLAAAPVLAAPALRDATLTTIVNTPGHAVSYRVD